jgi:hypothetical protein
MQTSTLVKLVDLPTNPISTDLLSDSIQKIQDCDFCHGDFHHAAPCPLKAISGLGARKAQGIAKTIPKEVKNDPSVDVTALIKSAADK